MTKHPNGIYPPAGTPENAVFEMRREVKPNWYGIKEHTFRWEGGNWYSKTTGHGPFHPEVLKTAGWEIVVKALTPPTEFANYDFHELIHNVSGKTNIWCFRWGCWYYSGPNKAKPEPGQTYFTPESMKNFSYSRPVIDEHICAPAPENRKAGSRHYIRHPDGRIIEWVWKHYQWDLGEAKDFGSRGWVYLRPVPEAEEVLRYDERIKELLEANNREVEAHRATKEKLRKLQAAVDRMTYGCTHGI